MVWLRENLPADTILCNGAGNYAAWIHRFYRFRRFATPHRADLRLDGLRHAVGGRDEAALSGAHRHLGQRRRRFPDERPGVRDRRAVRACRSSSSSATTACYGTIRMHQEREYPGRVIGDRAAQSRFRRLCPRLRRLRRRRSSRPRIFRRPFAAAQAVRHAGDRPPQDRSRSDHARDHAVGDPRQGARGAVRAPVRRRARDVCWRSGCGQA